MNRQLTIPVERFRLDGVEAEQTQDGLLLTVPADGGKMILGGMPMHLGGVDWTGMTHLVFDLTALGDMDEAFALVFMTAAAQDGPMCIVNAGILPRVRVQWPVALSLLDSQTMFIPRTPGRLKEMILGRGIRPEEAQAMILSFKKAAQPRRVLLHGITLTEGEPEITLSGSPIVDELGQANFKTWPGKTESEAAMAEMLRAERAAAGNAAFEGRSRFGGDLSVRWEGTGYFRTHFDGKRWYLADPDGYRFVSAGLDCCIPGDASYVEGIECLLSEIPDREKFAPAFEMTERNERFAGLYVNHSITNLIRVFGSEWKQAWMEITKARLIRWQFNTVGNWSDPEFIRWARLPYVWPLADFPTTKTTVFRDFPDVFSEEYEANAEVFAQQLAPLKDDECMVGYFLRNEPEWAFVQGLIIADKVLENPADTCCKQRMIAFLREKYGDIAALNAAWGTSYAGFEDLRQPQPPVSSFGEAAKADARAFSAVLIRRYSAVPSRACRKVDSHHLNLGMRFAMLLDPILLEGHENFDVFSLNGYDADIRPSVQKAGELTGKPIMIGEFHFGAPDAGMLAAAICSVATQEDRGRAYRAYYESASDSPFFVGAHYFSLNDQCVLGRFDGENCQIGMVDVCHRPYGIFTEEVTRVNREVYRIADGLRSDPAPEVRRIPRMMGF
ncbi:MAG: hypothetical protein IJK28_10025 [Clostridia bacterium]|nr:hypothetical protein [Clostridia bacterium]